jgi:hypothetical protein
MASRRTGLIPLDGGSREEVTVYVKGFLAPGEAADRYRGWHEGHLRLVASHRWSTRSHGWSWSSGRWLDVPVPVVSGTRMLTDLYRFSGRSRILALGTTAGWMLAEVGARFAVQYLAAERRALAESEALARALEELNRTHGRVRVVAHSLGCHAVVAAVASLPVQSRPQEIHLCGPAVAEGRVGASLQRLARERTYLYHCACDLVLGLAFPVVAWDRALGSAGPRQRYAGLESVDVGSHFGFRVHGEYKNRFADFAVRAEAA